MVSAEATAAAHRCPRHHWIGMVDPPRHNGSCETRRPDPDRAEYSAAMACSEAPVASLYEEGSVGK